MARRLPLTSGIQVVTAPQTLLTFPTGGIALSVLGNALYQWLTHWLPTSHLACPGASRRTSCGGCSCCSRAPFLPE
jgi:hypothetical protein